MARLPPQVQENLEGTLPLELERDIFELASWNDHVTGYSLIQVAKRVYEWVEPSLYRVLVIREGDYLGEGPTTPSPFLDKFRDLLETEGPGAIARRAKFVHHFMYTGHNIASILELLLPCTNIINLALWAFPISPSEELDSIMHFVGTLHLRRLSTSSRFIELYPRFLSSRPLAQSLTHLDCFGLDGSFWDDGWKNLKDISGLTSLAVAGSNITPTISGALQEFEGIRLVIDAKEDDVSYVVDEDAPWYADDPRFVFREYPRPPTTCWLEGTTGGDDIWALGMNEQRKKKATSSKSQGLFDLVAQLSL